MTSNRTPPKKKAKELAKYLRAERADYPYLVLHGGPSERTGCHSDRRGGYRALSDPHYAGEGKQGSPGSLPLACRELLAVYMERMSEKGAVYLFESKRKQKYTDRGVRKMLARYAQEASITRSMSPHKWRNFLFTWLKKEGVDDALIQPYSGHVTRQSLEIYSRLSLADAQPSYNHAMERFPIQ